MTRTMSPMEAIDQIRTSDSLALPLGPGIPGGFLHALGTRQDFTGLEVFGALLPDLYELFLRPGVHFRSGFYGPAERLLKQAGADIDYVPSDFRGFEPLLRELSPRVMATAGARLPDGRVSLSVHAGASVDELHRAGADPDRLLIVEVSDRFPRTFGLPPEHTHALDLGEIDVLVESDSSPVELADAPPTEVEAAIAEHASRFITDGCTLQTGIGGIPSTIARLLAEGPCGDFGVHSEMFTTGLMHLHRAGKVTNRKGTEFDGLSITTFAAGTRELYDWLDENPAVRFLPVRVVNSPELIARNRKAVTINGAIAVDLSGQVVADTVGGRQFSGIGGHEDFVAGPGYGFDDRSLLCLPSTTTVNGERVSKIVGRSPLGAVVSTPRHHIDVVITEFGAAELRARTVRERARALAAIAHPEFRDDLLAVAEDWPVG